MTNIQALARLHAIESFRRLPLTKEGKPYGPGFYRKRDWVGTLNGENRRVSLRLCRMPCIRCKAPMGFIDRGSYHPFVRWRSGRCAELLPLCRSCNASKGRRIYLSGGSRTVETHAILIMTLSAHMPA